MATTQWASSAAESNSEQGALHAFEALLGEERAVSSPEVLALYARSSGSAQPGHTPVGVLSPQTQQEVLAIVEIGLRWRVPLYPVSGGKNWGYGDAQPTGVGQFIVDLKQMNRILEVNSELCYAVIEPGVTQGQLHSYLSQHHIELWADSTGAGPQASVMGNTLDRGFGHTRLGDHFANCCGMEVVLGNGKLLKTGFGHYDHAKTRYVYKQGVGPMLDGLFSQSNFGIVTKLAVWLMPKPEAFCAYFVFAQRDDQLPALVDGLGGLRREGLIQSCVHIGNDLRVMSSRTQYPWRATDGQTPLPDDIRQQLRVELGITPWAATGILTGSKEVVRAQKRTLKRRLKGLRVVFLDDAKLARAELFATVLGAFGLAPKARAQLKAARPVYDYLKGVPNHDALRGTQWRVRETWRGVLTDPLYTSAGFLWVSPIVPLQGSEAMAVSELMSAIYRRHGFDPLISYTLISERALCCVSNIAFDKTVPGEAEKARACYQELSIELRRAGYPLYRTGIECFAQLSKDSRDFWEVVKALKRTLDPKHIMSPGRYEPMAELHS